MVLRRKILVLANSPFISGAEISLVQLIHKIDKARFEMIVLLPVNSQLSVSLSQFNTIHLPFIWFQRSFNPIRLMQYCLNCMVITWKIREIVRAYHIDIVYSNSVKSHVYGAMVRLFCGRKSVWQIRDNVKRGLFNTVLTLLTDKIICISANIYSQVHTPENKKVLIYGGIDVKEWDVRAIPQKPLREELSLPPETKLIVIVSQLTPWKNHFDFIKAAKCMVDRCTNVHFLVIGDILNPKDCEYKERIHDKTRELGMSSYVTFLGYREDVKKILCQVDVLLHTAIDEPFGRVLMEAMALEKPVVAYNCGGPGEIILPGETGYLVEPYCYVGLAEKTLILVENDELRLGFGKKGRERVQNSFTIDDSVRKMEKVFDTI
jgi:glycosyltransferase involved in cell wall biosynthesis